MGILAEVALTARTYLRDGYPAFLYFRRGLSGHVPAFCYHDISADEFESHLRYLGENGYRTLTCDELMERVSVGRPGAPGSEAREAALTFDDGLAGFYTNVYPLLEKYRMKAVAYIAPAWIGRPGFLTWEQCREMQASGRVDVQSHSYAHARVVTSARLVRVWQRSARSRIPWGIPGFDPSLEDGRVACLPVLEGASLFSAPAGLRFPGQFWQECMRVMPNTAARDVGRRYKGLLQQYTASTARIEETQLREWMTDDLRRSRQAIEGAIPGHSVRHFAFPWHSNSTLAWRAVEDAGFVSAAIGLESTDRSRGRYGRLTRVLRVNADFLPCLPGDSRSHFLRVLARKGWWRTRGRNVYGVAS